MLISRQSDCAFAMLSLLLAPPPLSESCGAYSSHPQNFALRQVTAPRKFACRQLLAPRMMALNNETMTPRPPKPPEAPKLLLELRGKLLKSRDSTAMLLRVTPSWADAAFGACSYVFLNSWCKFGTLLVFPESPDAAAVGGRMLALCLFSALQQAVGVPPNEWLRLREDPQRVDPNPLFQSGSPLAGVTFAFCFAVPIAVAAQLAGIQWIPQPRPFPDASGSLLRLFVAPLSEEIFFRAWLCTAFERAGGGQATAVIASAALFGLFEVPASQVLADGGSAQLLLYESLGAYLAFLYQRSGGSLALVFVTHATFNLLVTGLRAAQVGSALPF